MTAHVYLVWHFDGDENEIRGACASQEIADDLVDDLKLAAATRKKLYNQDWDETFSIHEVEYYE